MKKQLPHILSLSTVAKSRLFEIQAVDLKFSNGIDRTYDVSALLIAIPSW